MKEGNSRYITIFTVDGRKIIAKTGMIRFTPLFLEVQLDNELSKLNNILNSKLIRIPYSNIRYVLFS